MSGINREADVVENHVVVEGERHVLEGNRRLSAQLVQRLSGASGTGPALRRERAQLSMSAEGN